MVWAIWGGPDWGPIRRRKAFPCSVAFVSFCGEAFSCSVALVFGFWRSLGWSNMASVRASETSIKPMLVCLFSKRCQKERWARRGRKRTKSSKYVGKLNTLHHRHESSLASTWAGPIFGVHLSGAPMGFQKTSKTI